MEWGVAYCVILRGIVQVLFCDLRCSAVLHVNKPSVRSSRFTADWSGKQQCPNTSPVFGAWDNAYGAGTLTLSAAATAGISNTGCGGCYLGISSHGTAGNVKEKQHLADVVLNSTLFKELAGSDPAAKKWSWGIHVPSASPLVVAVPDRKKQWAVEGILAWYWSKGAKIPRERVFFFDDRMDNADFFEGTNFNSRQISCDSRDQRQREVGYCGATVNELQLIPGNYNCRHLPPAVEQQEVYQARSPWSHPMR